MATTITIWIIYMMVLVTLWTRASGQVRYSIAEEVKEGTVVGNIAKDLGLDKSTLKERGYRIVYSSTDHANTLVLPDRRRTSEEVRFKQEFVCVRMYLQILSTICFK
uniref:Cadherin N-terminal domain-containing protein n=1 Tax=Seriola dumerili TaxID=41447 RepID=A0A3B4UZJ7_SERDU